MNRELSEATRRRHEAAHRPIANGPDAAYPADYAQACWDLGFDPRGDLTRAQRVTVWNRVEQARREADLLAALPPCSITRDFDATADDVGDEAIDAEALTHVGNCVDCGRPTQNRRCDVCVSAATSAGAALLEGGGR